MQKTIVILSLLLAITFAATVLDERYIRGWNIWKGLYDKEYSSEVEDTKRFEIFVENCNTVDKFNIEALSSDLKPSQFLDMTPEEFEATQTGFKVPREYTFIWSLWKHDNRKVYSSVAEEEERFNIFVENVEVVVEHNKENPYNKIYIDDTSDMTVEELEALEELYEGPWQQWKATYNKKYSTKAEEKKRFKIFADADKRINEFNKENDSSKLAHNEFSDLTTLEFEAKHTGLGPVEREAQNPWKYWKEDYNKVYVSDAEEAKRFKIFAKNNKRIEEFSKETNSFDFHADQHFDMTPEEFQATQTGFKVPSEYTFIWYQWKRTNKIVYDSVAEEEKRFNIFVENVNSIIKFNKENQYVRLHIQGFTDMTPEELKVIQELYEGPWTQWKDTYKKRYSTEAEETKRFKIFLETDKRINEFNKENDSSKLAHNQFSDLTKEEFKARYTGLRGAN